MNPLALAAGLEKRLEMGTLQGLTPSEKSLDPRTKQTIQGGKLQKAAHYFEALLLSSWLGEMKESFSGSFGGEGDPASSSLQGLSISAVSSALASSGGFGIGKMILNYLQSRTLQGIPSTGK